MKKQSDGIPNIGAKIYSLIARKSPLLRGLYNEVAEEISSRISSGRIVDIGTGPGYLPFEIAKRSWNLEIIGVDISPAMVKIASREVEKLEFSDRVKFHIGDATNLPFEDRYFDFAVSTLSLHHWSRPEKSIREIYRILKENGEAWIYDIRRDTSKEVNTEFRKKYGWFLSFLFLNIVRLHSSLTLGEVERILSFPEIGFSKKNVEDKGVLLKLQLSKYNSIIEF